MSVSVVPVRYDDPRVQELVAQVQAEYVERYGGPDESPVDATEFAPPGGRFFVALRDDRPVAMGGWRLRPDLPDLGARRAVEPGSTDLRLLRGPIRAPWLRRRPLTGHQPAVAPDSLPSHPSGAARDGAHRCVQAEIKRMYVVPHARRTGVARLLLRTLEDTAREDGCDVLVLETGLMQPEAIALYESAGYVGVTPFGHYKDAPLSRYYGRRLIDPT